MRYFDVTPSKGRNGGKAPSNPGVDGGKIDAKDGNDDKTDGAAAGGGAWEQVAAGQMTVSSKGMNKGGDAAVGSKRDEKEAETAPVPASAAGAVPDKDRLEPWTAEEDATLHRLKGEQKPWKQIADAIPGRPAYQCKERFKHLPTDGGATAPAAAAPAAGPAQKLAGAGVKRGDSAKKSDTKNADEAAAANDKKDDAAPGAAADTGKNLTKKERKALAKAATKEQTAPGNNTSNNELVVLKANVTATYNSKPASKVPSAPKQDFTGGVRVMDEDDMFNFDELNCLVELVNEDPEASWERLAGRFFKRTGRRIEASDVRDKLEFWSES